MLFRKKPPPPPPPAGGRPSDEEFLSLVQRKLAEVRPELTEHMAIRHGILVGQPDWAVVMLPADHGEDMPYHFEIGFIPSLKAHDEVVPDCIIGLGNDIGSAVDGAVHIWASTSGACLLEYLFADGTSAKHLGGDHPRALPGWHTLRSGVLGYGPDTASNDDLQRVLYDHRVLNVLAEPILAAVDRPKYNGVKVYVACTPKGVTAEVRVNGVAVPAASEALAALPWPTYPRWSMARFYALLVHPDPA